MIKIHIVLSIIAIVLTTLTGFRCLNKNIKEYINTYFEKKTLKQKILIEVKEKICCFIPIVNIIYIIMAIWMLLASELTVIKILSLANKKKKTDEQKIKEYIEKG
jgi:hypothetical protein